MAALTEHRIVSLGGDLSNGTIGPDMTAASASGALDDTRPAGPGGLSRRLVPGTLAAWALWGVAMVAAALGLVYGLAEQRVPEPILRQSILSYAVGSVVASVYASTGLFLRRRRPDIVIGWLFIAIGIVAGASNATWAYSLLGTERSAWPGIVDPAIVGWLGNTTLAPAWFGFITALGVLFPDGRPHRPIWRRLLWLETAGGVLLGAALAIVPGPLIFYSFVTNPVAAWEPLATAASVVAPVLFVGLAAVSVAAIGGLLDRYRDGDRVERAQLRWFAWALVLVLGTGVADAVVTGPWLSRPASASDIAWVTFAISAMTIPVAALFAILRYRLYDIDRVISRTFVFGSLTAILAGVYAASIRLFTAAFIGITGESSDGALVLTTLVLATSFTPIKQRLESVADRRLRTQPAAEAPAPPTISPELIAQVEAVARRTVRELLAQERTAREP